MTENNSKWLDELLADPVTAKLVGIRYEVFSAKWRKCFGYLEDAAALHWYSPPFSPSGLRGNFNWENIKPFVWPAILGPYWFAYRKIYIAACVISLVSLLLSKLSAPWLIISTTAVAMAFCFYYALGIYLCHIRDAVSRVNKLSADDKAQSDVLHRSPTSWIAVVVLIAAYAAVSFGIDGVGGLSLGESLGDISACNSSAVKNFLLKDTFLEPQNKAIKKITNGEVMLMGSSIDPRSVTVKINNFRQISYDRSNRIRQCVADYSVEAPMTEQSSNFLGSFGVSPDQAVPLFVRGWKANGVQFGICNGEIHYTIQTVLDGGENKERLGWRCVSSR